MVAQHYRWDFVGLSTDTKPTPATSEKVVDGSTYYCSDTSKLYVWCKNNWYERKALGGDGGSYTAGTGIDITDDTISVDTETIQPKLTAGTNITISDDTISATDTTYSNFVGTDGTLAGTAGLVPAPAITDAGKFLKADGTWDTAGGGSGPTVVQTTGTSTTDVMSQNAVTDALAPKNSDDALWINNPKGTSALPATLPNYSVTINPTTSGTGGGGAKAISAIAINGTASGHSAISIGVNSSATQRGSIAIGRGASATTVGEMNIGTNDTTAGYNSTNYRLISGVHDGQNANDAVTVNQVNSVIDAINTALNTNISHIGA